jgi:type II secretory pathway component PulJ
MSLDRRGVILLEAMVGLALLASAAMATVTAVAAALANELRLETSERQLERADRHLTALALLARTDLDRRIGATDAGEFVVFVTRPERTLYRISLGPAAHPAAELLATVVYRPEDRR